MLHEVTIKGIRPIIMHSGAWTRPTTPCQPRKGRTYAQKGEATEPSPMFGQNRRARMSPGPLTRLRQPSAPS